MPSKDLKDNVLVQEFYPNIEKENITKNHLLRRKRNLKQQEERKENLVCLLPPVLQVVFCFNYKKIIKIIFYRINEGIILLERVVNMKRCSKFILILILILSVLNLKITNSVKADSYNSESIFPVSINMESLSINDTNEGKTLNSDNAFLSFISSPLVNTILLILAFTSLVVELFVPGFGVFGFLSLFSFILFFIGGINTGSVDIISMSMFALGLVLLFIELLIPGFGVAGVTGIFSLIAGLILSSQNISHGIVSVSIAIFISIIVSYILIKGMKSKLLAR